ncbi:MAG: sulfatase-like hydrolase/transferase [Planctomycetaceae bacterium]
MSRNAITPSSQLWMKQSDEFLRQLDESGLAERTLVIWYSDNGAFMLPGRGLEVSSNKPLRDGGVTLWEEEFVFPAF